MIQGVGLFGKTPATGDFICRNMARSRRVALDRWLTGNLVPCPQGWPEGGVRAQMLLAEELCLVLSVPSCDKVGRKFPLVAVTWAQDYPAAEDWCTAAAPWLESAAAGMLEANRALAELAVIPRGQGTAYLRQSLWRRGAPPLDFSAENLGLLFSSG